MHTIDSNSSHFSTTNDRPIKSIDNQKIDNQKIKRNRSHSFDFSEYDSRLNIELKDSSFKPSGLVPGIVVTEKQRCIAKIDINDNKESQYRKIIGEEVKNGNKYMIKPEQTDSASVLEESFLNYTKQENSDLLKNIEEHINSIPTQSELTCWQILDQHIYQYVLDIAFNIFAESFNISAAINEVAYAKYKQLAKLGKFDVMHVDTVKTTFENLFDQNKFMTTIDDEYGKKIIADEPFMPFGQSLKTMVKIAINPFFKSKQLGSKFNKKKNNEMANHLINKAIKDIALIFYSDQNKINQIKDLAEKRRIGSMIEKYRSIELIVPKIKWMNGLKCLEEFDNGYTLEIAESNAKYMPELIAAHIILGNTDCIYIPDNIAINENNVATAIDFDRSFCYGFFFEKFFNETFTSKLFGPSQKQVDFTQRLVEALNKYVDEINRPGSEYANILSHDAKCRLNNVIDILLNPEIEDHNANQISQFALPKINLINEASYKKTETNNEVGKLEELKRFAALYDTMDDATFKLIQQECKRLKLSSPKYALNPTLKDGTQSFMEKVEAYHEKHPLKEVRLKTNNTSNHHYKNEQNSDQLNAKKYSRENHFISI